MMNRLLAKDAIILIAFDGEDSTGYMCGYDRYKDGSFYVWMCGVKTAHRKKGVLYLMMESMLKRVREAGFQKAKIKTRNGRREMLAFLVKTGWNFLEVTTIPETKVCDNRILLELDL